MTSLISPKLQSKITTWRLRAAEGTLELSEMKEAVALLRQGRLTAANASAASKRKKAIAEIPHADDMLSELDKL